MREFTPQKDKGYRNEGADELIDPKDDPYPDVLSEQTIVKVLSAMPERASREDVTAVITNIVLAYELQNEWGWIVHASTEAIIGVMEEMEEIGYNIIH